MAEHILSSRLGKFTAKHHPANAEDLNLSAALAKLSFIIQNTKCKAEKIYHGQSTEIQSSILKTRRLRLDTFTLRKDEASASSGTSRFRQQL